MFLKSNDLYMILVFIKSNRILDYAQVSVSYSFIEFASINIRVTATH